MKKKVKNVTLWELARYCRLRTCGNCPFLLQGRICAFQANSNISFAIENVAGKVIEIDDKTEMPKFTAYSQVPYKKKEVKK